MTSFAPSPKPRRWLRAGLVAGLALVLWGVARWAGPAREAVDPAPLDIRGRPIRAIPVTNAARPGSLLEGVAVGVPSGSTVGPTDGESDPGTGTAGPSEVPKATAAGGPGGDVAALEDVQDADRYRVVGFDRLAGFTYEMPAQPLPAGTDPETVAGRIPPEIRALDRQKVAVKGFMLPMKLEDGRATELLLMRDQSMCCFGVVPNINDWVNVKLARGVKPVMDQPVTIAGTFRVGAVIDNGYLVCIYAMDGERMTTALDE